MGSFWRRDQLARRGEALAAKAVEAVGLRILARRVRTRYGEIDLLAEKGALVVFIEVKTRTDRSFGEPIEAIDRRKADSLRKSAMSLVQARPELAERPLRIDVVEVIWPPGAQPEVRHHEDAVDRGDWY